MLSQKPKLLLSLGMLCVLAFIVLNRFVGDTSLSDFFQGMCVGVAITVLPASLFLMRKAKAQ